MAKKNTPKPAAKKPDPTVPAAADDVAVSDPVATEVPPADETAGGDPTLPPTDVTELPSQMGDAGVPPADATLGDAGDGTVQGDPGEQGTETTEADQVVPAEPEPAGEPGINDVVRDVAAEPDPIGFLQREPMPYLSPDESRLQAKLFNVLARRGLLMRDQGGVYPYLLRQIAGSLAD